MQHAESAQTTSKWRRPVAVLSAMGVAGMSFLAAVPASADEAPQQNQHDEAEESQDLPGDQDGQPSPEEDSHDDESEPSTDTDEVAEDSEHSDIDAVDGEDDSDGDEEQAGVSTEAAPAAEDAAAESEVELDFVGINDLHGRLGDPQADSPDPPGAEYVAAGVQQIRAESDHTFFVAAGDNFGGAPFTSMILDEDPTVEALNAMELDVSAVGNHEFDQGIDVLQDRIDGAERDEPGEQVADSYEQVDWDYLGANVYDENTDERPLDATDDETITTADGEEIRVRFIGLVTEETPSLVTKSGVEGLEFHDPLEDALAEAEEAEEDPEIDVVVVLIHDGGDNGSAVHDTDTSFGRFAEELTAAGNVDAIFSGHTHVKYDEEVNDVPVIQTGSFSEALGHITLTYDPAAGEVVDSDSKLIDLAEDVELPEDDDIVNKVQNIVEEANEKAADAGNVEVGEAGMVLDRAFKGNGEENRGGESVLGNLIADVQSQALAERDDPPQIALMNPGGIRTDIDEGDVTYRQVADVQPFGNTLVTFDLTGEQVLQVLEEQWQPDDASRPFLKLGVAGLSYTYDPQAADGAHITQVVMADGQPLAEAETYRVVANNFVAEGGDNFVTAAEGQDYSDTGVNDLEVFVDYFEDQADQGEPVVLEEDAQRAVGVHWNSDPGATYEAGEEISLDLSSLMFTGDEPAPQELSLALTNEDGVQARTDDGGVQTMALNDDQPLDLGTTEVDTTVADDATGDESGTAEVRVQVPEDIAVSGEEDWQLLATDGVYDYTIAVPVTLAGETEAPGETPTGSAPTDSGPPPTDGQPGPAGQESPEGQMPATGTDLAPLGVAIALLGTGGALLAIRRRQLNR